MREHETLVFWTWNPGICAYNAWIRHEIQENNEDLSLPCDWNIKKNDEIWHEDFWFLGVLGVER